MKEVGVTYIYKLILFLLFLKPAKTIRGAIVLMLILVLGVLSKDTFADPIGPLSWVTKAPVIDASPFATGVEGAAAGRIGDNIYVSHGFSLGDTAALRIYNITTDTWTLGPSAIVARSELAGVAVGGKFYAIGGRPPVFGIGDVVEIFDPITTLWTVGPFMPTPRAGFGVAALDGKIHVIGGRTGSAPHNPEPLDVHEVFDPVTNTWDTKASLPTAMMDNYATVAIGGKIYVFGGFDGVTVSSLTQIYDPVTDSWSFGTPMPTARSNAIAGVLADHPIVIGGLDDSLININVVEVYHPASDTWTIGPPKPTPASEMASAAPFTSSEIFAIGSGAFGLSSSVHESLLLLQETCDNGIDDDGDGLVDCDDPDCSDHRGCCRCADDREHPTGCIAGGVTEIGTGFESVAGKRMILRRVFPKRPVVRMNVVTDDNGCYNFTDLEDGVYKIRTTRIRARKCKGEYRKVAIVVIAGGGKVNDVNFWCR